MTKSGASARVDHSRPRVGFAVVAAFLLSLLMATTVRPAMAAGYVDAKLGDVKAEDKATIAEPRPVQVLFQFRTKGAPNGQGTKQLKPKVLEAVKASGLFSEVGEGAVATGAILNVVIDDVILPKEMQAAEMKGAATGATMFIAGSNIRENYKAQLDYVAGPDAPKITRTASHSIIIQMGLINKPPENAVKVEGGINGAVFTMTRQIVSNPLNELAKDPAFLPAQAPAAATPATDAPSSPAAPAAPVSLTTTGPPQ
jgi:hypothetical protein